MRHATILLLTVWVACGCRQNQQHLKPSSLLAYNDAAEAARLGRDLGAQSTASIGQDIQLQTTEGRILRVRPTTVVYLKDTQGTVHRFRPPFEVRVEGETLSIEKDSEEPRVFRRSEIADVYVLL
jgi:hypothetical protein